MSTATDVTTESHGTTREREVREIAARLGVADFVFTAPPVKKGSALREASGDGLLIVGSKGAVLQVKARDLNIRADDSITKGVSWTRKNVLKAIKQGRGTRREIDRLNKCGTPLRVIPVRAATLPEQERKEYELVIKHNVDSWPVIVVIDHPLAQGVDIEFEQDCIWMTLSDWNNLLLRLRSVSAILTYVERVISDRLHVPMGQEGARYRILYEADVAFAAQGPSSTRPYLVDPVEFDQSGVNQFHSVMDTLWPRKGMRPWSCSDDYRSIVEFMDRVPATLQSAIGHHFAETRQEVLLGQPHSSRLVQLSNTHYYDRLNIMCSHLSCWPNVLDWQSYITNLALLRHHQAFETGAHQSSSTLAIGTLVDDRTPRPLFVNWFALLIGREALLPLAKKVRTRLELNHGILHQGKKTIRPLDAPRKGFCPCGSGKNFKRCCEPFRLL